MSQKYTACSLRSLRSVAYLEAYRAKALGRAHTPTKEVLVHKMMVAHDGNKASKSLGNST